MLMLVLPPPLAVGNSILPAKLRLSRRSALPRDEDDEGDGVRSVRERWSLDSSRGRELGPRGGLSSEKARRQGPGTAGKATTRPF